MNQKQIHFLKEALSEIEDFRQAAGKRYELVSVLLLCCISLMCGYKSTSALAEWGKNYGRRWLKQSRHQEKKRSVTINFAPHFVAS